MNDRCKKFWDDVNRLYDQVEEIAQFFEDHGIYGGGCLRSAMSEIRQFNKDYNEVNHEQNN